MRGQYVINHYTQNLSKILTISLQSSIQIHIKLSFSVLLNVLTKSKVAQIFIQNF